MRRVTLWVGVFAVLVAVLGVANYLFGFGIGRYSVPAPSERLRSTLGVAHDVLRKSEYPVDIAKMLPFMREARWSTEHTLWKLPVRIELESGEKVLVDAIGSHYQIEGVRGTFYIDQPGYEAVELGIIKR